MTTDATGEVRFTPAEFEAFKADHRRQVVDEVMARLGEHKRQLPAAMAAVMDRVAELVETFELPLHDPAERYGAGRAFAAAAHAMREAGKEIRQHELVL